MERKKLEIRKAAPADCGEVLAIYDRARRFMRAHGNPHQWAHGDGPSEKTFEEDVAAGRSYVAVEEGLICATFFMGEGPDPSYGSIEGAWLNDGPYVVLHRVASAGIVPGAAKFCLQWAGRQSPNVRIDTHEDNYVMQNLLRSQGFTYCGIIYLQNGDPRQAFQKVTGTEKAGRP